MPPLPFRGCGCWPRPAPRASASTLPGARSYEALIGSHQPAPRIFRPGTDTFLSYTGGTTGLPKGVEYVIGNSVRNTRMLGRQMLGLEDIDWEGPALDRALLLHRQGRRPVALPASPLMHSTGLIMASLPVLTAGGTVVTLTARSFDPDELFTAVAATRPRTVSIAGDAFARPMVRALDRRASAGDRYDTTSLVTITSAGVAWSAEVKRALLEHIPQVVLVDACGSSEGATIGSMIYRRGGPLATDRFQPASGLRILRAGEDGEGLEPAAVSAAVRARLAGYEVPRTVLIAPVPRAPNGKVLVEAARRLFSGRAPDWRPPV
jgi:fatty-acyl-CoA synthase